MLIVIMIYKIMIVLKNYQEDSIIELEKKAIKQLGRDGQKTLIFKSPTGSGKTLMIAEFIKRLINKGFYDMSFIWAAPRKLHIQSKEKLELYYKESQSIKCSFFHDLDDKKIGLNEILFLNWESINKEKNLIVRENERDFFLDKVLSNTKDEGRDIILIIDESHFSSTTEISTKLIADILPKLIIEVSATPILKNENASIIVDVDDVKQEGMIKKSIIFQDGYKNELKNDQLKTIREEGSDILVLDDAIKKRIELEKHFKKNQRKINPLILIQLPDRKTKEEDDLLNKIITYLKTRYSITPDNNKLAIYLSEKKENLLNIAKNDNEVQILIFKQAITLGWDCPRASILVLFRNWKSLNFSIQTIGRIMRMPEPDYGHYKEEKLNHGYFFTNIDDIKLNDDYAKDYITINKSKRKLNSDLSIESCHRLRRREKTRLDTSFIQIFLESARELNLKNKINLKESSISISMFSQEEYSSINEFKKIRKETKFTYDAENVEEIQKLFDIFTIKCLAPDFYPEKRSLKRINYSIYKFFETELEIDFKEEFLRIIKIVLDDKNSKEFIKVIDKAKLIYINEQKKKSNELAFNLNWDIPKQILYLSEVNSSEYSKSIMQPFFYKTISKTEMAFMEYLENSKEVIWWFKNGDRDDTYFAVPYNLNDEKIPFYVDFIIKFKNNKIGFYDTKGGITITEAFASGKALGLFEFIEKNKNFSGGIISNQKKDYSGSWIYFNKTVDEYVEGNFDNWDFIDF